MCLWYVRYLFFCACNIMSCGLQRFNSYSRQFIFISTKSRTPNHDIARCDEKKTVVTCEVHQIGLNFQHRFFFGSKAAHTKESVFHGFFLFFIFFIFFFHAESLPSIAFAATPAAYSRQTGSDLKTLRENGIVIYDYGLPAKNVRPSAFTREARYKRRTHR